MIFTLIRILLIVLFVSLFFISANSLNQNLIINVTTNSSSHIFGNLTHYSASYNCSQILSNYTGNLNVPQEIYLTCKLNMDSVRDNGMVGIYVSLIMVIAMSILTAKNIVSDHQAKVQQIHKQ